MDFEYPCKPQDRQIDAVYSDDSFLLFFHFNHFLPLLGAILRLNLLYPHLQKDSDTDYWAFNYKSGYMSDLHFGWSFHKFRCYNFITKLEA
jgi:hypothetical protein